MKHRGKRTAYLIAGVTLAACALAAAQSSQKTSKPAPAKAAPAKPTPPATDQRADPLTALLQDAAAAMERKDYAAAIPPLQSYLAQHPEDATAQFQLGYAYSELQRWDEAMSAYRRAIALDPKLAAAHLNLGLVLLDREPAAAVECFRQAAELMPEQARPRFLLALALERAGKLAGAIEEYQAAERLDAKEYEIRFALGRALLRANRATEAEAEFREALALRGDAAPARLGLAESLRAQNKLEAAAAEFAAYLQLQPQDRESRLRRASVLTDLGHYEQALEELDRGDAEAAASLESYRLRAEIRLQQKQWAQAGEVLQKALELAPRDPELHARLGRVWLEKRDFPAAERELRQALQLDRNWTDALRDLVAVYYLGERYQATLQILDELDRRETPSAGSWFIRATCYDKLGRKAEAVAAYEKFLALDQGHSENQGFQARQRIRILARELEQKKR